ncbi:DUF6266 family protein [Litoribacter populi]|uniref:DUF6266 family protein n=1 Tax=Litoribacter populi TaxID=2598460 RepID=UPI00117D77D9|nr:DUF6266 family protein [Litoribacter populi]
MARASIFNQGLRGKKGNDVYYTVGNKTFVRAHFIPDHSKPSSLQLEVWGRFRNAQHFIKPIKKVLQLGYVNFKDGMQTPMKIALGKVLKGGFRDGQRSPDPALLKISTGSLAGMDTGQASWKNDDTVLVEWEDNSGMGFAKRRDKVSVLLYDVANQAAFFVLESKSRVKGQVELTVDRPDRHRGNLHVYTFFTYKNPRSQMYDVSDSVYPLFFELRETLCPFFSL